MRTPSQTEWRQHVAASHASGPTCREYADRASFELLLGDITVHIPSAFDADALRA